MLCRGLTRPSTILSMFLRGIADVEITSPRSLVPHRGHFHAELTRTNHHRPFSSHARNSIPVKEASKPASLKHLKPFPLNSSITISPRTRGRPRRTPRDLSETSKPTSRTSRKTSPKLRTRAYLASQESASPSFSFQRNTPRKPQEPWGVQKSAIAEKLQDAPWYPKKRLSPDALEGIRALHAQYPLLYTTPKLAEQFKISPEAIRRILKSKWRPNEAQEVNRRDRWERREGRIWDDMEEMGLRPEKEMARGRLGRRARDQDGKKNRKRNRVGLENGEEQSEWEDMKERWVEGKDDILVTREEAEDIDRVVPEEEGHHIAFEPVRESSAA